MAKTNALAPITKDKSMGRVVIVDNFKGLLILFFFFTHSYSFPSYLFEFPTWMHHSGGIVGIWTFFNFTLMDIGPIAFFFLIGLTMFKVFDKHVAKDGKKAAYKNFFARNLTVFGFFAAATYIKNRLFHENVDWENLHAIGITGVFMLPFMFSFIRKNTWVRLVLGVAILTLYHFFYTQFQFLWSNYAGGMTTCIGFMGVVFLASVIQDLVEKKRPWLYLGFSVLLFFAAWGAKEFFGDAVYKAYNSTYMIMCTFAMNTIYLVFYAIDRLFIRNRPIPLVATVGRNILLYILLTFLFVNVLMALQKAGTVPPFGVLAFIIFDVCVYTFFLLLARFLEKKRIIFKF